MDRYAVIGHPVTHSRSPAIHARFAAQCGQAIDYGRLESPLDGFKATVTRFAAEGARGCNVTVPFKFEAYEMAVRRTERAELAQAVNTLRFDADGWWGDNTDGAGLVRDIEVNAGRAIAGQLVLLIGAGGAAAGVLGPLIAARPQTVWVLNRTAARADSLVARHAGWAHQYGVTLHSGGLDQAPSACDLVLNGTASSLAGDAAPVDARALKPGCLALDMMYGAAAQPFLRWASRHGAEGRDGLGMLVEQAAESFAAWRGVRPDTGPVLAQLRAEVDATLPTA